MRTLHDSRVGSTAYMLWMVWLLVASAANHAHAEPVSCPVGDEAWIELRFDAGRWPALRRQQLLNELRLGFEILNVSVCPTPPTAHPPATLVITLRQPSPDTIDVQMVLDNPGPDDPVVSRQVDVSGMLDDDRWLTLAWVLDEMAQATWSQRVIPVVVMDPIVAPAPVIPPPVVVVVPPQPLSRVTLGARGAADWYTKGNTTLFGGDVFSLLDILGGPIYIELAVGARESIAIETTRSDISGRLLGAQLALGVTVWRPTDALRIDLDLSSRTSLATFSADKDAAAWIVDLRGTVRLRWLIARVVSLQCNATVGAPLVPFTTQVEANDNTRTQVSVLGGALLTGGLGIGWQFW